MRWTSDRGGRSYRLAGALCLGLTVVFLPACESIMGRDGQIESRTTASAVRDPVLEDIPKPSGFRLVDDGTFGVFAGRVRIARCEYAGTTDRAAVKHFYEEYMPSAGFELREWTVDEGRFDLRFESGAEVCNVLIYPGDRRNTILVVHIKPKSKGPAEHETTPPMRRPN